MQLDRVVGETDRQDARVAAVDRDRAAQREPVDGAGEREVGVERAGDVRELRRERADEGEVDALRGERPGGLAARREAKRRERQVDGRRSGEHERAVGLLDEARVELDARVGGVQVRRGARVRDAADARPRDRQVDGDDR